MSEHRPSSAAVSMGVGPLVPIDSIKHIAHRAAEQGLSLNEACPYPFDSEAGRRFKSFYFFHIAALEALAQDPQS